MKKQTLVSIGIIILLSIIGLATIGIADEIAGVKITISNLSGEQVTEMTVGETFTLTAKAFDDNGNEVPMPNPIWESSEEHATLTVDPDDPTRCKFTATSEGEDYALIYPNGQGSSPHDSVDITISQNGGNEQDKTKENDEKPTPGFELLLMLSALSGTFIYLRRKK